MENAASSIEQHRGPVVVPRGSIDGEKSKTRRKGPGGYRKPKADPETERRRAAARAYYHANKARLKRERARKAKAPVVFPEGGNPPAVPKRPSKIDALVCINRSLRFLHEGDIDGAELWNRFAARIIEGKE